MAGNSAEKQDVPRLFDSQELENLRAAQKSMDTPPAKEPAHPLPVVAAKFPRIAAQVVDLWGTPECDTFLNRLIIDDRGDRAGFPPEVLAALLDISRQHQQQFGFALPDNVWVDDPLSKNRSR